MQSPVSEFRQSSIISEKPGYFSEKFKALASFNCYIEFNIISYNFAHVS